MNNFLKDFAINMVVVLACMLVYPTLKNIIIDIFQFWTIDFGIELIKNISIIVFVFMFAIFFSIIDLMRRYYKK